MSRYSRYSVLDDLSKYREEFTLGDGASACLLVHGLGCGPIQMRELAESLSSWGFTARGILLPGHCGDTGDIACSSLYDWAEKVSSEYFQLKSRHDKVVVIGFSLGALLALQLAIKQPVEGVIVMGAPIYLIRRYLPINSLIRIGKLFIEKVKTRPRTCYMKSKSYTGHLRQPINTHYPLKTLHEIKQITKAIKPGLKNIKAPALIIHSQTDRIAAPGSAKYLFQHIGSADKRSVWLERSHHLVMYDDEKDVVFNAIEEFLLHVG